MASSPLYDKLSYFKAPKTILKENNACCGSREQSHDLTARLQTRQIILHDQTSNGVC